MPSSPRPHASGALLALALSLVLGAGRRAGAEPLDASTRDFQQIHLEIRVRPDLEARTVEGRVRLTFESLVEGLARLRLHCEETRVLACHDASGEALAHAQEGGILSVELSRPLARGDTGEVTVVYRSTPTRGLYFHRPLPDAPKTPWFLYSQGQGEDNRRWIPCYDLPDDRCRWDLHATVPDTLRTVSNGVLVGSSAAAKGLRTDHWRFEDRSPTYLISLIAGPLQTLRESWGEVVLEYSAPEGREEELRTALRETPHMIGFFSTWLDAPYPWARYAQTFVWDFVYGGMENTTATTLNMRALHTEAARPNYQSEPLVAHELAHMWFGDLLTCRTWEHIWLNEGFATYLTDLWYEDRHGREEFLLRRRDQNEAYLRGTPNPESLGLEIHPRGDLPLELHGGKQYDRGAAILHMLRKELGDETFRDGVRRYVRRCRDCDVTSEGLRHVMEEVAGRDLSWFWAQWVYGAGYPVLEVAFDAGSGRMEVRQVQARAAGQGLFRLTLPVRRGAQGAVVPLRIWQARHVFQVPGEGAWLRVGVDGDLLARIGLDLPREAWEEALVGSPSSPAPSSTARPSPPARRGGADPDVTARLDAVEALEPHGSAAAPSLARALSGDPAWAVRRAAARALGRMDHDATAGRALLDGVGDPDPRVREAVYEALGARTRAEAGAALLAAARGEPKDYPRAAAAHALGRLKAEGARETLRALLEVRSHGDCVRAGALEGLRALGDPEGAAQARRFCAYRHGDGGTHRLRQVALRTATALAPDDRETHALLVSLLADPFHRMRGWAAEACGTYGVVQARAELERLRDRDASGGVRGSARRALERLDKR